MEPNNYYLTITLLKDSELLTDVYEVTLPEENSEEVLDFLNILSKSLYINDEQPHATLFDYMVEREYIKNVIVLDVTISDYINSEYPDLQLKKLN